MWGAAACCMEQTAGLTESSQKEPSEIALQFNFK
jgi:hypothetical protein